MAVGPPKDVFQHADPVPPTIGPALDVFAEPSGGGGGGAGTVTSVDVDGGTTGLTTTGGPITTSGTIELHLLNDVQLAGRNASDTGDIGLIGTNAANQITVGAIGIIDNTDDFLRLNTDSVTQDRGFASYSATNVDAGGNFVGMRSGGTHSVPTKIPDSPLPGAISNFSGLGYDGSSFLRPGVIQIQSYAPVSTGHIPTQISVYVSDGSTDAILTTPKLIIKDTGNFQSIPASSGLTWMLAGSASFAISTVNTTPYAVDDSADYTLLVDTSGGSKTVNLPASPDTGRILNIKKIAASNTLTIGHNGKNIDGAAADLTVTVSMQSVTLQYSSTFGWSIL